MKSICVIGMGYVGLPLAIEFSKHYNVIGFDIDKKKINKLKKNIDTTGELKKEILKRIYIASSWNWFWEKFRS